jgi:hypothetical protein
VHSDARALEHFENQTERKLGLLRGECNRLVDELRWDIARQAPLARPGAVRRMHEFRACLDDWFLNLKASLEAIESSWPDQTAVSEALRSYVASEDGIGWSPEQGALWVVQGEQAFDALNHLLGEAIELFAAVAPAIAGWPPAAG